MRFRLIFATSVLAAVAAGCGNSTSFHGKPIAPIAVIEGPGGGPTTTTVNIDGSNSYDPNAISGNGIYTWEWTLASAPAGSNSTVEATPGDESHGDLVTDIAGTYVVQLRVRDINDFTWSEPVLYTLQMFPLTGLDIIMSWSSKVNDVDLHLVDETGGGGFFGVPDDCYFQNLRPDWAPMGSLDGDPSLHHDEVNGFGPEILELPVPTTGNRYHVYLHYFSDDGLGETDATLDFYIQGQLVKTMTHEKLAGNEVWDVTAIDWGTINATFTDVDSISTY